MSVRKPNMLVDWGVPITFYLLVVFPTMRFITKSITKYRGRQEIPDEWKIPITGVYCGALAYAYQTSGATSGWLAVSLFAASVGVEKLIQFWRGPTAPSNSSVKPTR